MGRLRPCRLSEERSWCRIYHPDTLEIRLCRLVYATNYDGQGGALIAPAELGNGHQLAAKMREAVRREEVFHAVPKQAIDPPFSRNWAELWESLLPDRRTGGKTHGMSRL